METAEIVKTYDGATAAEKRNLEEHKEGELMAFDDRMKQPGQDSEKEDEDNDIMSHLNYRKL